MIRETLWEQKLAYGEGIAANTYPDSIRALIPGCIRVEREESHGNDNGIDYRAYLRRGTELFIDVKSRERGASNYWTDGPELALEIWSVVPGSTPDCPNGSAGWTLDESKKTDYTLHVFDPSDSSECFILPFQLLRCAFRHHLIDWTAEFKVAQQETRTRRGTRRWKSECVFVPAQTVILAIDQEMRGTMAGGIKGPEQFA